MQGFLPRSGNCKTLSYSELENPLSVTRYVFASLNRLSILRIHKSQVI